MKSTARKIVYDEILKIEAFHLKGVFQPFPNHFHEYYVIGLIERGKRKLFCRGREYLAAEGDILLFHPGDNHACTQEDEEELDYRGLNISPNIMSVLVEELTGRPELPGFSQNLIRDQETACCLKNLHELLMWENKISAKRKNCSFCWNCFCKNTDRFFREKSHCAKKRSRRPADSWKKIWINPFLWSRSAGIPVWENLPYSEPLPEKKGSPHTVIWRHSASTKPENFWKRAGLSQRRL